MIKIIHAADLHLDSPFDALDPALAALRRAEQRALLKRIALTAAEKNADLLLLAGDIFDTEKAYAETLEALKTALSSLDCAVFIAPGNHDYCCAGSPYDVMELPENVHVFRKSRMQCVTVPEIKVRVWGAGFEDRVCRPLLHGFRIEKNPDFTDICVIHGEVGKPDSDYNAVSENDIAESGMDYIAFGHVHSASGLKKAGSTFYAWPGCTEGRGFDECGEKGILYVELENGECRAESISLGSRKYEVCRLDISGGLLADMLPVRTSRDVYRLILTGETDESPDTAKLYDELKGNFFALEIKDETKPRQNIWEKAGQDSLRGLYLRRMRAMYEKAATDEEKQLIMRAVRWGVSAIDGGEEVKPL